MVSLGIFSALPATEPCALRSTQHLKVSTRDFFCGEGGRCVWLTTYHPCSAETSRKSGALIYLEPLGPPRPVAGDRYFIYMYIYIHTHTHTHTHTYVHTYTYVVHTYICTFMHAYIYIHIYMYIYIHIHTYITYVLRTYIHTYIHKYTHT